MGTSRRPPCWCDDFVANACAGRYECQCQYAVGLKLAWGVVGASLDGSLTYPNAHCGRGLLVWLLWYALVSADGRSPPSYLLGWGVIRKYGFSSL